ncbi:hypothetical protein S245_029809, partial [Arachis hypogaea]
MENKEENDQLDCCLWDPCKKSHADKRKGMLLYGAFSLKPRRLGSMLSWSTSAKDLRELEMEKEKEDETSPRGVLEAESEQQASESNASGSSSSSRARSRWGKIFKLWKIRPTKNHLPSLHTLSFSKLRWKSKSTKEDTTTTLHTGFYNFRSSLITFSLSELQYATNNFSSENLIGRGGFAEVYQGCLEEGKLIAVKKLTNGSLEEKTADFLSELGVIAHVDHPNTAKIIGCCVERDMHLLVFSLSPLGSLGSLIHGPNKHKLDWSKRYKIALGIADGLLYLHENCHRRIIHRDIKAENILLTENFDPQICDFGLAKWLPEQWTHCNVTKIGGTFGYFAPEYCMHGIVDEKTDIFSFGVLLLEIISGRPALDDMQKSLVLWAKPLLEAKNIEALVDPSLDDDYDKDQVGHVVFTASKCVDQSPILRPCMSEVVTLLRGHDKCDLESRKGQRKSLQRTYSEELLDAQEYNSTKYLRDLNRHRQL